MIIEIPFCYKAEVIPPRARNPRSIWVLDRLPVNIGELPPERFPVAVRYMERFADLRGKKAVDVHSDGRKTYMALEEVTTSGFEEFVRGQAEHNPFSSIQRLWLADREGTARHGEVAGRILADDRQERIARLLERAANIVVCGDRVFNACGEPAWKRVTGWAFEAVLAWREVQRDHPGALVRADRLDEIVAEHPLDRKPDLLGSIEVLRPDLLRLSVELPALLKEVEHVVESLGDRIASGIETATRDQFDLYATLRDAFASAPEGEMTEDLASAIHTVIDTLPKNDHLAGRLGEAHERWRKDLVRDAEPNAVLDDHAAGLSELSR